MDPIYEHSLELNYGETVLDNPTSVKNVKKTDLELDINTWVAQPDEATKQEEMLLNVTEEVMQEEAPVLATPSEDEVRTEEVSEIVISQVSEEVVSQVTNVVVQTEEVVSEGVPTLEVFPSSSLKEENCTSKIKWRDIESVFSPPIDIIELDDSYHIYAELPGISVKDVSIDLSNNMFTLTGDKRDHPRLSTPVKAEDVIVKQEINKGRFKRVLELPDNVDTNDVNVDYEGGMLQFKIRKIAYEEEEENYQEEGEEYESGNEEGNEVEEENKEDISDEKSEENNNEQSVDEGDNTNSPKQARHSKNMKGKKRSSCLVQ